MFQQCFSSVSAVCVSAVFQQCFSSVSAVFQQCFSSVSAVIQQCFSSVSAVFQRCFSSVSAVFQIHRIQMHRVQINRIQVDQVQIHSIQIHRVQIHRIQAFGGKHILEFKAMHPDSNENHFSDPHDGHFDRPHRPLVHFVLSAPCANQESHSGSRQARIYRLRAQLQNKCYANRSFIDFHRFSSAFIFIETHSFS